MEKIGQKTKTVLLDTLGVLLMLAALAFGWIPGPGGLPLFLAGLGLLSINHEWARRWLEKLKKHGFKIKDKIFVNHAFVKGAYDLIAVALVLNGIYLFATYSRPLHLSIAIFALFAGVGLFLGNRERLDTVMQYIKHKNK